MDSAGWRDDVQWTVGCECLCSSGESVERGNAGASGNAASSYLIAPSCRYADVSGECGGIGCKGNGAVYCIGDGFVILKLNINVPRRGVFNFNGFVGRAGSGSQIKEKSDSIVSSSRAGGGHGNINGFD